MVIIVDCVVRSTVRFKLTVVVVCVDVCIMCIFCLLSTSGNYVLQYLGNRLNLTAFVTQSLVQVSKVIQYYSVLTVQVYAW